MRSELSKVGDAAFQKKSFDKIQNLVHEGRTVFFVSHNMSAVTRICERAILFDEGCIVKDGPAYQVVASYLNAEASARAERIWLDPQKAP